ncbi:MAG TPA: cobalamin-independent methionine synthase II family protein [Alphaproteobacteria bacterium]|nr:cobalamin-independent methionine synthase II family protein [Alphaproteobacteria bacterium]
MSQETHVVTFSLFLYYESNHSVYSNPRSHPMSIAPRADHIGSFLRPAELLEARRQSPPDSERLRELEDAHIKHVLARQKELGFEIFTDGETRRRNFMSDFTDAVEGFDLADATPRLWASELESMAAVSGGVTTAAGREKAEASRVGGIVTAKLRQVRRLTGHELSFLLQHSPGPIKMTLPSATQFPAIAFKRRVTDRVYKDHSELLWAVVEIIKAEMAQLSREGVDYIQIDAPRYSYYIDPKWREWIRTEMRVKPSELLDESIRADNACLEAARKPGVTLGMHICRGNNRSHWYAEGGYDAIAEKLFDSVNVDRFLLEYDDERSGTFAPLRFVPSSKTVVLGLISSKRPQLESGDELMRKIQRATHYVPLERLALSPQCGFASTMEGNLLTEDEQWAKMRLAVETARRVWG